jgi:hypothetical protein
MIPYNTTTKIYPNINKKHFTQYPNPNSRFNPSYSIDAYILVLFPVPMLIAFHIQIDNDNVTNK